MRNILFTVLFIGILSLIASPISLASKSLHKANMINLSNNAIICMHQDPDGYLWIGTYDGLNLYNGKDTYVYRFVFVVISFTKYPTQNPAFYGYQPL